MALTSYKTEGTGGFSGGRLDADAAEFDSSSEEGSESEEEETSSESEGEHVLEGLETIAEEDRNPSALSYQGTKKKQEKKKF